MAYRACGRYRSPSPERHARHASSSGVRGSAASDEEAEAAAAYHAELERPLEDDAVPPTPPPEDSDGELHDISPRDLSIDDGRWPEAAGGPVDAARGRAARSPPPPPSWEGRERPA
eukprot:13795045-Alexandrium_andersonii.AAC.1